MNFPKPSDAIWCPHPGKQREFLSNTARETLFGGAAGPGKSDCLLMFPLHFRHNRYTNWLLIRRFANRLKDLIERAFEYYPAAGGIWEASNKQWRFRSGARIGFGFIEKYEDALRYKGPQFTGLAWDELTGHPADGEDRQGKKINRAFVFMQHRLRCPDPTLPLFIRSATNPGGPGHAWVRSRYEISDDGQPSKIIDPDTGKRREFIPARLDDNPTLAADGEYKNTLNALPENDRKALRDGRWDIYQGQAFREWNPFKHIVEPFQIPNHWKRWRSMDDGYAAPACILWFAENSEGRVFIYQEVYQTRQSPEQLADTIKRLDKGLYLNGELDPAAFSDDGRGKSRGDRMNAKDARWKPAAKGPGSRMAGKSLIHSAMSDLADGYPGIRIFRTCENLIRTLPQLPTDKNNSEDVDTTAEDHAYDALRYGLNRIESRFSSTTRYIKG